MPSHGYSYNGSKAPGRAGLDVDREENNPVGQGGYSVLCGKNSKAAGRVSIMDFLK